MSIPGNVKILHKIYESANSEVYRGVRQPDGLPVILKILKQDYPAPAEIARYKTEYEIARNLNLEGVAKAYSLEPYNRTLAIILEDFGGESLKILTSESPLSLPEFLKISIQTADSLAHLHAANIIHKDINPANIVYNPSTQALKIIDFGISTQLTRENPTLKNPSVLEGTLAYMSPEQTGRMNRSLDYRTDFYSLGVTFYELLTGRLPFETDDALELVHCHIAKNPLPPHQLVPEIPFVLSEIVIKLMAKTAEERYQSAWGLKADLEQCLFQLQQTGTVSNFPLASQDISEKFQIPQKLYGREAEIETLLGAFKRAIAPPGKVEMMLVAGYSGIGKSALVQEIYKPITESRGYFISGKFDQFQRNIPYSAIVAAFQGLVRQILSESEAQLKQWREKLLAALGQQGKVIADAIPAVELILGKQPPVPELGPAEAQNRFNLVFSNFIRAFCTKEHPLVIFLDDLQWADLATLKLIELMMRDESLGYLFLIGAYRDNEVSPTHPTVLTIEGLRKEGATIDEVSLTPLRLEHIAQLIADSLHGDAGTLQPLAELVERKTGGNPFFVSQFLKTLYQEKLLAFHQGKGWQWDIAAIAAVAIADNVVDLTIAKLQKFPEATQQVLRLAACIGNKFDLNALAIAHERSPAQTFADLMAAIEESLIVPLSELEVTEANLVESPLLVLNYKFLHDRVQQAAYALIDEEQKKAVHLKIGRLLRANMSPKERSERLFELADHLNVGREFIADAEELAELATLNLEAGKKAKDATAYAAAREYLRAGMESLTGDIWGTRYELAVALYEERAEVEYLNGNFAESEALIRELLTRLKTHLEKAEIYNLLLVQYTLNAQYGEAIETGRKALALLGVDLPETNLKEALTLEIARAKENLGSREIAALIDEPKISAPEKQLALKLLVNTDPPAYFFNQELYAVIVVKAANISLQYGNIAESSKGFVTYGIILGSVLGNYRAGYEFGVLAVKISEKFNNLSEKCSACLVLGGHLNHWVRHIKWAEAIFNDSYQSGLEVGELRHSGYALEHQSRYLFYQGKNLEELAPAIAKFLQFSQKTKNQWATDGMLGFQLALWNLSGRTSGKFEFHNDEITEKQYLEDCRSHKSFAWLCTYNIFKSQILYLYGEVADAYQSALEAKRYIAYVLGHFQGSEHNFFYSLILAGLYAGAPPEQQKHYWKTLKTNQKQMKIWADNCPENFLHKYLLVAAEMARISGEELEAMELYDRAIAEAEKSAFVHNEALANELAGKFWLGKGKEEFAEIYLKKARYGYQLWGAQRKVEDLDEKYPHLLAKSPAAIPAASAIATSSRSTSSRAMEALDLAAAIKASQAISREIVLEKLLGALMKIAIESAGAQTGHLILETEGTLFIEASGSIDSERIVVLQSIPIENSESVSSQIVNYVARTLESVVLNDATREGHFTNDDRIRKFQPKSILCAPLLNQGKLAGILYLENNLTAGAFTADRLEVLNLLSSQAAIAIANARLYSQLEEYSQKLEQKVSDRTAELAEATRRAEAASVAKSAFLANMSHELRSPLNAILGFTQLMARSSTLSPEHRENLGIITRSGEHLLTLINQVLDLSKIESGRTTLNETNFDLYRLLDDLEDMFHLKADEKGLHLLFERTPDLPRYIRTDEVKLRQVLINLLNNALKFTAEGGVSVRVGLRNKAGAAQPHITFEVEDTGAGISSEELDSVFEAFVQSKTGREASEGTGLGLPISRQFVKLMKGEMAVKSTVGKGTLFQFYIQVSPVDAPDVKTSQPAQRVIALEPNQPRYRILIVDDKWENRQLLIKLLNPLGFELAEASNGQEAVEIWENWEPHLIWMDMRMPVMNGCEATKQIKSSIKGHATAIIALTASAFEEERAVVISAGCDDFLRKPFREADIFEMMHKHIGVRFAYAEPTGSAASVASPQDIEKLLIPEAIAAVPRDLLASLEQAVIIADLTEIDKYIQALQSYNSILADTLATWAVNFDYGKILSLLQKAK